MNESRNHQNRKGRALRRWLMLALCLALLLCGVAVMGEGGCPKNEGGEHSFTNYTYNNDATCTQDGTETATCDNGCEATDTRTKAGSAKQHSFTKYEPDNNATCTENGTETATCDNGCGSTNTRKIENSAKGHSFINYVYNNDASCTKAGTKTAKCENCDATNTVDDPEHPMTAHTPAEAVQENVVPATCTEPGSHDDVVRCSACGAELSRDPGIVDKALGHVEEIQNKKDATCGEDGYTGDKVCTRCNVVLEAGQKILATGNHTWNAGEVTTPPTKDAEGVKTFTCTVCNQTYTETIPKLVYYKVTFVDEDGKTVLKEATEYLKDTPADQIAKPADPTKPSDGENLYTFKEWTPALAPVTADATYKAVYTAESLTKEAAPYKYKLNPEKTEATILSYSGSDANLIVPDTFEGGTAKVVGIAANAFKDNKTLTSLVIPATVKTIGDNAFAGCTELVSLTLPDALRPIKDQGMPLNIVTGDDKLATLTLRCTGHTTLTGSTITHQDKEGDAIPAAVTLPMAVTDIIVTKNNVQENPANLTLGDFTVQEGHSISVEAGATLTNTGTITNFGSVANSGTFTNNGTVNSCAGKLSGVSGGTVRAEGQHSYDKDKKKCTICNADLPKLSIKYNGSAVSKVYDKTRNVKLSKSSFAIEDTHGLDLTISKISASYDKPDAGKRKVNVTLTLSGDDADLYKTKVSTSLSATIEPKPLIITPSAGQKKTYGAANPKNYTGKVKGLLSGDKITGKLSREQGETAGKYRIQQGTIDAGDNYDVQVLEEYFTIEPKSINASDVGLVSIGNQRYTGKKVEPAITLRFGKNVLKQDIDFKAEYTDNVQPGLATVKLTGIGNYTGSRETSFRILNIASGVSTGSSGSGGGYSYDGFDDGETESTEDGEENGEDEGEDEGESSDEGRLLLGEQDYGTILFDASGKPCPFVIYSDDDAVDAETGEAKPRQLTIIADPLTDEATGETLLLDDGEREQFDELHLRLTMPLVDTLTSMGYSEIVYQVENAELIVPLSSLAAEIPLENAPAAEVVGTVEGETEDLGDSELVDEAVDELEVELVDNTLQVAAYDICVEQSEVVVLTDREMDALAQYKPLTPVYRLRVRAVTEGDEGALETPADGETALLPETERLPEKGWPANLVLRLQPLEDDFALDGEGDATAPGAVSLYVSTVETDADPDQVTAETASFVDVDGSVYIEIQPRGDGLYGAGTPSDGTEVEDVEDDEEDEDDEDEGEELEDLGDTAPSGLSSIGGSFTLDENGNPVMDN